MTFAKSINQLAQALGVSRPAVTKWLTHPEWVWGPRPTGRGWPVEPIDKWRQRTLAPDPARRPGLGGGQLLKDAEQLEALRNHPLARAKLTLLAERAAQLRFERELREKKYVLRAEIEDQVLQSILQTKAALLALPAAVAPLLVQRDNPAEIAELLRTRLEAILQALADTSVPQTEAESSPILEKEN